MILFLFLLFSMPQPVYAQEPQSGFVDNICKQILSDEIELSPKVLLEKAVEKTKDIPEKILAKATEVGEKALEKATDVPETLATKIESLKKPSEPKAQQETIVAGASTDRSLTASAYNAGIDVLSLLIKEWMWTLGGLAVLGIFWGLRA